MKNKLRRVTKNVNSSQQSDSNKNNSDQLINLGKTIESPTHLEEVFRLDKQSNANTPLNCMSEASDKHNIHDLDFNSKSNNNLAFELVEYKNSLNCVKEENYILNEKIIVQEKAKDEIDYNIQMKDLMEFRGDILDTNYTEFYQKYDSLKNNQNSLKIIMNKIEYQTNNFADKILNDKISEDQVIDDKLNSHDTIHESSNEASTKTNSNVNGFNVKINDMLLEENNISLNIYSDDFNFGLFQSNQNDKLKLIKNKQSQLCNQYQVVKGDLENLIKVNHVNRPCKSLNETQRDLVGFWALKKSQWLRVFRLRWFRAKDGQLLSQTDESEQILTMKLKLSSIAYVLYTCQLNQSQDNGCNQEVHIETFDDNVELKFLDQDNQVKFLQYFTI